MKHPVEANADYASLVLELVNDLMQLTATHEDVLLALKGLASVGVNLSSTKTRLTPGLAETLRSLLTESQPTYLQNVPQEPQDSKQQFNGYDKHRLCTEDRWCEML
eukprot:324649-Amphidinium_carterae.1